MSNAPLLSIIIPCLDEEATLDATHHRLVTAVQGIGGGLEVLYVDDGSRDRTWSMIQAICLKDNRCRGLSLSRNFGHQQAVSAGLDHATGRVVALMDADLQDPPELIPSMLARWADGADVVYGRRISRRGDGKFKRWTAAVFYRLLRGLSDTPIPMDVGDFRLMDRKVVDAIRSMPERDRFLRGMIAWSGFRQEAVDYERDARIAGTSKYPLHRMLALALNGLVSFSLKPLRLATWLGFSASLLALAMIVYALWMRLFTSNWVSGWTFLVISVALFGGIQLICLGIIGEYVGRTYHESKRRPLYLLRRDTATGDDQRTL